MFDLRRLWHREPKRGMARGVGVFGGPGFADNGQELTTLLGHREALSDWMRAADVDLAVSAAGLRAVDVMINTWDDNPTVALTSLTLSISFSATC